MPRPWRIAYSGAKYHITARGNGRHDIFLCDDDYIRFLEQLALALEEDEVVLYGYALMSKHYHLFIETPHGNIKRFMQRLNTAYSMYYRYKHSKPGHCFQGRYSAKLVAGDDYIISLIRYIHLNPVKIKRLKSRSLSEKIKYLRRYKWSSYPGYIDSMQEEEIIDYHWLSLMGRKTSRGNRKAHQQYAEGMIEKDDEEFKDALSVSRYAIGDEKFIEEIEGQVTDLKVERGVVGRDVFMPKEREIAIEDIEKEVAKAFKVRVEDLHIRGKRLGFTKGVAIELICQLTKKTQREIGLYFGYKDESSTGKQRKGIQLLLKEDGLLKKKYISLKKKILAKYSKGKKR